MAKATGVTGAILIGYVSTAVVADLGNLADGRQLPAEVQTGPDHIDPAGALIDRHDCSTTGLGAEVPSSGLVRRGADVELVPFAEAWAVHQGTLPGTLVAVCRADVPARPEPDGAFTAANQEAGSR